MATENVKMGWTLRAPRWLLGVLALVGIIVAEVLVAIPDPTNPTVFPYQQYGLTLHILLVFVLLFTAVYIQDRDIELSVFLVALSLAPLIRIFSLSMPRFWGTAPTATLPWLAVVGIPLLVSAAAVAYVQQLPPWLIGLGIRSWSELWVQTGIGLTGIALGLTEYTILRPQAWVTGDTIVAVLAGGIVMFFSTGLAEELIFRGILMRRAIELLGTPRGVLFVTCVFAAMHIFYRNPVDLTFVFGVGLLYAVVVLRTRNLWGAIMSHTLANVTLYLIAPFLLARLLPPIPA